MADTSGIHAGDVVRIPPGGTGFPELDNRIWVVGTVTSGKFTLLGTDLSNTAGVLAADPVIYSYANDQMVCLCLSDFKANPEKKTTVSVATYCDPSASIPSATTTAGTIDIGGFVDIEAADYKELLLAEEDGVERVFRINLPNNGSIVFPAIIASLNWQIPLEGAIAYEGELALGSRPRHLF
jgi:hypothetical protein